MIIAPKSLAGRKPVLWEKIEHNGQLDVFVYPHTLQAQTLSSRRPFVVMMGGQMLGKTSWGPVWMTQHMEQFPGHESIMIAPTYKQLHEKAFASFLEYVKGTVFEGELERKHDVYHTAYGPIILLSATKPDTIQGYRPSTVWADELGQYSTAAWHALRDRVDTDGSQLLGTTTPYGENWLFHDAFQAWQRGNPDFDFIVGNSLVNPAYSRRIWEQKKRDMTPEEFAMFMEGKFQKLAGLVYPDFDRARHCKTFSAFKGPCVAGLDFGADDPTASPIIGYDEKNAGLRVYKTYYKADTLTETHVDNLAPIYRQYDVRWIAYDPHGLQQRRDMDNMFEKKYHMTFDWIPVTEDIETGVRRLTRYFRNDKISINDAEDANEDWVDELEAYKRNKLGIPEARGPNHACDAARYATKVIEDKLASGELGVHAPPPDDQPKLKPGEEVAHHAWQNEPSDDVDDRVWI